MTPLTTRITEILEAQQVDDGRILGIATTAAKIVEAVGEAVDAERKRCAEIVQLARHHEIDSDFRSIIHRIEDAWDPARLEDEKAEMGEGK